MYRTLLVPIDLGRRNLEALEVAMELASVEDGRVILLHVIETLEDVPFEELEDFYSAIEEKALGTMSELVSGLGDEGERIERRIVYGRRVREILKACAELGADLLVLHSHRVVPGDRSSGIGTLSHELAVMSEIPVLLVK